jgi:hypothetical protein
VSEPARDLLDWHASSEPADGSGELELDVDGEGAEVTLHVRPEHLDRIQLGAVRRQVDDGRADVDNLFWAEPSGLRRRLLTGTTNQVFAPRLEGIGAAAALSRLYAASRPFVNFFQPSFKLAEKKRVGARVTKRYHVPETPCGRLLQSEAVPETTKERLRAIATTLDPLRLLDEIRTVQHELAGIAAGKPPRVDPHRDADLDQF